MRPRSAVQNRPTKARLQDNKCLDPEIGQSPAGVCLMIVSLIGLLPLPLLLQDQSYHQFTDQREFFGIPNFWTWSRTCFSAFHSDRRGRLVAISSRCNIRCAVFGDFSDPLWLVLLPLESKRCHFVLGSAADDHLLRRNPLRCCRGARGRQSCVVLLLWAQTFAISEKGTTRSLQVETSRATPS
jgi:hypothetical protein